MQVTINIPDELISKSKYVFMGFFAILAISYVYFFEGGNSNLYLLIATIFAIYMAVNLGANDVANNMGPAVGSKALTLAQAIILAMIFEAAGALIAGGDVVNTIKGGIINGEMLNKGSIEFIAIMLGTLLGAAIWVNIATFFKAPVSITHAIIGGLVGAGMMSAGTSIVYWDKIGQIAIAWLIAILMGALISIAIFISIRKTILKQEEKGEAAKHWVPIYVSLMVFVFSLYLILKGFKHILSPLKTYVENAGFNFTAMATFVSFILAISIYTILILRFKAKKKKFFEDSKEFVNELFNLPLIFSVALLSFAHGANDVANAIGPLAAIKDATSGVISTSLEAKIPLWIMIIGALSLSFGLGVFGARLIKSVGGEITKLDQTRAYSIALSAAITVIIASALGLPVSTTQIALGGIFGIGLYRQYLKLQKGKDKKVIQISKLKSIILSWIITLPVAGIIAAVVYKIIIFLNI